MLSRRFCCAFVLSAGNLLFIAVRVVRRIKLAIAACVVLALTTGAVAQTTTPANRQILARIALLADPHVNRATNGADAAFKAHFEKAIAQVNAAKVDFVLIAGDLTQSGKPEEFADFKTHVKEFHAPVWFVSGNHDVGHKFNSGKTEGTVTRERVETYEKLFGPSWFVKERAGVRFIGINSSLLGSGFEREGEMWKFLEKELARPVRAPIILFMHYPLFLKELDEPSGDYFNTEPRPRMRIYNLLKQSGVKTVLTGHLHRTLVNRRDGILFVTTPPISFGLPRGKQPEGWMLITVFQNGEAKETIQVIE